MRSLSCGKTEAPAGFSGKDPARHREPKDTCCRGRCWLADAAGVGSAFPQAARGPLLGTPTLARALAASAPGRRAGPGSQQERSLAPPV